MCSSDLIASLYDVLLLFLFSLTNVSIVENLIYSVSGALMSIISALLVIAFAKNKMEGMALIKMCGLLFLGIPIVYFIKSPIQYVFSFLPSYWMAKISATGNIAFFINTY